MKGQPISVSKAKKAIADYKKAIGRPNGMVELSIFYCEEAFGFLESCSIEDESYFAALIRMYGRSIEFVSRLPHAERTTYVERLDKLRSRGRNVGWAVEEEFNSLLPNWVLESGRFLGQSGLRIRLGGKGPVAIPSLGVSGGSTLSFTNERDCHFSFVEARQNRTCADSATG
jgi:hypothetical protein